MLYLFPPNYHLIHFKCSCLFPSWLPVCNPRAWSICVVYCVLLLWVPSSLSKNQLMCIFRFHFLHDLFFLHLRISFFHILSLKLLTQWIGCLSNLFYLFLNNLCFLSFFTPIVFWSIILPLAFSMTVSSLGAVSLNWFSVVKVFLVTANSILILKWHFFLFSFFSRLYWVVFIFLLTSFIQSKLNFFFNYPWELEETGNEIILQNSPPQ